MTALPPSSLRVGADFLLAGVDPRGDAPIDRAAGKRRAKLLKDRLGELQEMLWVDGRHKLLLVLQAMDTGGKDSTIRRVFEDVNPVGVRVVSFRAPSPDELAHDFLWRVHRHTPTDGQLVIFNRSHYEDVLVVRVHGLVPESRWRRRYEHIRSFERMLVDEGTTIVKVMLHISRDEQRQRLQDRVDDPRKRWKFSARDLEERERWDDYMAAFQEMLTETSTPWAPWYVVPADRRWYRDLAVSEILVEALEGLDLRYPPGDDVTGVVVT